MYFVHECSFAEHGALGKEEQSALANDLSAPCGLFMDVIFAARLQGILLLKTCIPTAI